MKKKIRRSLLIVLIALMLIPLAVGAASEDEKTVLEGKSVLFVGDSLCEGWCEWNDPVYGETVAWAGRIMKKNNMSGINKSLGGASLSDCRKDNTVLAQLKAMSGNTYDLVILQGGVNDAWDEVKLGKMTEGFNDEFDFSTFAGGLETTLKYAKDHFPDAIIAFTISYRMPKATFGSLGNMRLYVNLTKRICEKWDVPYLDLYNDNDFNNNVLKSHTNECLPDAIHPNSKGYNLLAPKIEEWMISLYSPPTDTSTPTTEVSNTSKDDASATTSANDASSSSQPPSPPSNDNLTLVLVISAIVILAVVAVAVVLLVRKKK